MADQFDEFLDEVQNDIKHEKYRLLWEKYGRYATTAAVSLLAAAALFVVWQNYQKRKQIELSDAFLTAQSYIAQNKIPEAFAILDTMKSSGHDAYSYLSRLQKAALLIVKDDTESKREGVAIYESMATERGLPTYVQEYATLLLVKASVDGKLKTPEEAIALLKPLLGEKKPWHLFASELTGQILYSQGKYREALEIFADIVKQENVPEGLRLRARMMVQVANQNVRFKS
ncbi:MAG: tetratricopeptide repeat protein [Alphaproteobacteria bacterium]|nr:tetratricopeptide repeat protein [Alphaproteobacteria bacterium]